MAMKEGMRDSPPSSVEGDSIKRGVGCARDVFPHVPSFPVITVLVLLLLFFHP
jgi:hypothetical protein